VTVRQLTHAALEYQMFHADKGNASFELNRDFKQRVRL
jgi:hypothetical protein